MREKLLKTYLCIAVKINREYTMPDTLSSSQKEKLRNQLYSRDGHICHYCMIKEYDFLNIWKEFYGRSYRGKRLEIDRKGNNVIENKREYTLENCVLACALCNMAKSDKFTEEEFKKVGEVIRQIWQERKIRLTSKGSERQV